MIMKYVFWGFFGLLVSFGTSASADEVVVPCDPKAGCENDSACDIPEGEISQPLLMT